jgi:hypothetical protein
MDTAYYKMTYLSHVMNFHDEDLRKLGMDLIVVLPNYFWELPASSSGHHHPVDERGQHGLVIHSFRVARAGLCLTESRKLQKYNDIMKFCGLFHDGGRYGFDEFPERHTIPEHPEMMAEFVKEHSTVRADSVMKAINCIRTHSGLWGKYPPQCEFEWMFHDADNVASKLHLIM